jgi:hypothetical protein
MNDSCARLLPSWMLRTAWRRFVHFLRKAGYGRVPAKSQAISNDPG